MTRIELQEKLENILGSRNVYFQPPSSTLMSYDAIVYDFDGYHKVKANNGNYILMKKYRLTYIHKYPETDVQDKLISLEYISWDRQYKSDNMYHDIYIIYI